MRKLDAADRKKIIELRKEGYPATAIAKRFGISAWTVSDVVKQTAQQVKAD